MRPTGSHLVPPQWSKRLGIWSAWSQRRCPHPEHRVRAISGDQRLYGYRWQCMECGQFGKDETPKALV